MKKLLLLLVLSSFWMNAQTFTELNTANLIDVFHGDLKWGDYDNDGDLDLLVTGKKSRTASGDPITKIYTNNGGTFTELATANIENIEFGDAEWGDYDNDGDLDLVVIGATNGFTPVTKIYTNTNGTFSELTTANLTSVYSGSVDWGDYDNDGDLDILLTGGFLGGSISKIYTNTNGVFSELTTANLTAVSSSDAVWGDYDNDGDLDILLTGYTGSSFVSKIYTNNNNGTFTELTSANLTGVSYSSVAWGDYDNDGDLDILLTGTAGFSRISKIYTNTAGSFTELPGTNFLGVEEGSVAWGDCDNDGDLDVLITGSTKTAIHINTAGVFTQLATPDFPQLWGSSAVWGDYDNDGDLDIAMAGNTRTSFTSKIFTNNSAVSNTIPTAPTNPTAVVSGNEVTLSWTASTDVETPASGLSYNVFIKENPVGSPIYTKTPMAQEGNGWRKLPNIGNTQQNTSYIYKLPAACSANYTFKVQAIDHAFAGSAFSTEGSFSIAEVINPTIITQDITVQLDTAGNATITPAQIDNGSSDNCGIQSMSLDMTTFNSTNVGANTVTLTVTDINGNSDSKTAMVTVESIFTELNTASLSGAYRGSVAWGDYDNDGDLDLLLTGWTGSTRISKIYTNTAGTFTELAIANLPGVNDGSAAWGDYDNDGDLDILLTGWDGSAQISKIYRNDAGAFTELTSANLTGVSSSSVAWGDYDNDGDLDVLLAGNTGSTIISKIYTNASGVFTELVTANLTGVIDGSVDWVDYDNDGDLDIALTGYTGSIRISKIYRNTAGVFTELAATNLPQVSFSSTAWGDYDNDGDLDVLVTGREGNTDVSKIYTNTAGVFTELNTANLTGVNVGSGVWGDYDNDGDLDVLLTGFTTSGNISKVYTNTAGTFTELASANLAPVVFSTAAWGDYDNDGDLDIVLTGEFPIISKIYTNNSTTPNTLPTAPTNPTAIVNGDEVTLSWAASTDAETPSNGLSYNVYIKESTVGSPTYTKTPMAQENDGWRKLPALGNAQQNTSYTWKLPEQYHDTNNNFVFKVQAIDHSFAGSAFSTEESFNVDLRPFIELTTVSLIGLTHGEVVWGDYDNDGDLDVLLIGSDTQSGLGNKVSKIYTNTAGVFTELPSANLPEVGFSTAAWGDYDNDGDLDILLTGQTVGGGYITTIYTNTAGVFTELATANLPGIGSGSVAWGDYDNDGDLDILLTGGIVGGNISKIYTNTEGLFTELATANLQGVSSSSAAWGDYDNDGDLDVLLTGFTGSLDISKIYTNNAGVFTELASANLTGVSFSSAAWGDYDNDGDLDIVLTGFTGSTTVSKIYTNTAGTFTELATANLPRIQHGSVAWGDYDNDGDLDILLTGVNGANIISKIYTNAAGVFTELTSANLTGVTFSSAAWGDYDSDGDLDIVLSGIADPTDDTIVSKIYTNNSTTANTVPTAPTNPIAMVNGDEVTLSWTASTDAETPSSGLSYNVFIKENPVGSPVYTKTPMAQENNGWRKLPAIGNAQQNTSYVYKIAAVCTTDYTFKVQAIDHNFAGSAFSAEGSFSLVDTVDPTVVTQDITVQLDASGNATIAPAQIDNGSSDVCGIQSMSLDTTTFDCTDVGANMVTLTVTDVSGNSASETATVLIEDTVDPTVATQNITVQLDASGNVVITAAQIDNGSSDNCSIQSMSLDTTTFDCTTIGANTVTLTITDVNGNSASETATVLIEDNVNPTVIAQNITVQLDASGNVVITAAQIDNGSSDNCSIQSMSLDSTTFDCTTIGANMVTLTVTDVNGNSASGTATVLIEDTVNPTVIAQNITVQLDASGNATITAAQIDNGSSDNCSIQSMSLDSTTFDCTDVGANMVTLTVTDIHGNSASDTAIVTVEDSILPTVATQDITVQLDTSGNATITATQIDNGSSDICGIQFMRLDTTTFDCTDVGVNTVILTVTDVHGNSASDTAIVTVEDTVTPAVVTQNITVQLNASGNATITATQIDNGSSDICGIQFMRLDNTTFDCADVGVNTVTLTVTDVHGNSASDIAIVTIEDNIVPLAATQDITVQLDAFGNATITSAQIDVNNSSSDNCGIQSISLDTTTFDCTTIGVNTVTLTVTDIHGNSASNTAIVTVEDNIDPVFETTTLPNDEVVTFNNVDNDAYILENYIVGVAFNDNCDVNTGGITISQNPIAGTELVQGDHLITITATDSQGNDAIHTFTITVDPTLSIEDNVIENLYVYPNPTNGKVHISIDVQKVILYDVTGKEVLYSRNKEFDMSHLESGVYFVHIFTDKGNDVIRIMKN